MHTMLNVVWRICAWRIVHTIIKWESVRCADGQADAGAPALHCEGAPPAPPRTPPIAALTAPFVIYIKLMHTYTLMLQ